MPDMHVRVARYDEAGIICKLVHESMTSYCRDSGIPDDYIEATTETADVVRDAIASGVVFVALDQEEQILGTCRLYIRPKREFSSALPGSSENYSSRIAYFARFSVWDAYRGQGIGNDLLKYCEKIAQNTGCSHILLHTALSNKNMVSYYLSRGFEVISSDKSRGYDRGLFSKSLR